jgi:hypothetical protein
LRNIVEERYPHTDTNTNTVVTCAGGRGAASATERACGCWRAESNGEAMRERRKQGATLAQGSSVKTFELLEVLHAMSYRHRRRRGRCRSSKAVRVREPDQRAAADRAEMREKRWRGDGCNC